jgi:hypothetical protein
MDEIGGDWKHRDFDALIERIRTEYLSLAQP